VRHSRPFGFEGTERTRLVRVIGEDPLPRLFERPPELRWDPLERRRHRRRLDRERPKLDPVEAACEIKERLITTSLDVSDDPADSISHVCPWDCRRGEVAGNLTTLASKVQHAQHLLSVPSCAGPQLRATADRGDIEMEDASELSSLLASLEDISRRIASLVESRSDELGSDAELVALERALLGAVRRMQRAVRSAERRSST